MKVKDALKDIEKIDNTLSNLDKINQLNGSTQIMDSVVADANCNNTWINIVANARLSLIKHKQYLQNQIDSAEIQDL